MIVTTGIFDVPVVAHFADNISWAIFNGRQPFGVAPLTRLIAGSGHRHVERFMGPLRVVDKAPLIKVVLPVPQTSTVLIAQDLRFQGAMKTFVFTLGLG